MKSLGLSGFFAQMTIDHLRESGDEKGIAISETGEYQTIVL